MDPRIVPVTSGSAVRLRGRGGAVRHVHLGLGGAARLQDFPEGAQGLGPEDFLPRQGPAAGPQEDACVSLAPLPTPHTPRPTPHAPCAHMRGPLLNGLGRAVGGGLRGGRLRLLSPQPHQDKQHTHPTPLATLTTLSHPRVPYQPPHHPPPAFPHPPPRHHVCRYLRRRRRLQLTWRSQWRCHLPASTSTHHGTRHDHPRHRRRSQWRQQVSATPASQPAPCSPLHLVPLVSRHCSLCPV